jgi:protoporphyrin/coproporphyrin ferrochelatase
LSERFAVLLVNLGTPEAPTRRAVRRFLAEFLSDPRVVELPRLVWLPILHGIVLNTRPSASARKYAAIWTSEGSPLKVHTERQAKLLRGYLGERLKPAPQVAYAMRYGKPSIAEALDSLAAAGAERAVVIPLYPQYAASTTLSVADALARWARRHRKGLAIRMVDGFHDDPLYIKGIVQQLRSHQEKHGLIERLVLSFHGLPQRAVDRGDPYRAQCERTAALVAREFGLSGERCRMTFQSRFGAARWLQPYTAETLERMARDGVKRVDVMCPGFPSDCLETLEEIGIETRERFLAAGGAEFHLIPCLNERHEWIQALAELSLKKLSTWPEPRS